jgi:ankyrin repeat protein
VAFGSPQRVDTVEWLLEQGASVQDQEPAVYRHKAFPVMNSYGAQSFQRLGSPWNPLRQAVICGNEKIVRLLLNRGADPNLTDNDVLEQAVKLGRLDIVRMLVEHGVQVKDKEPIIPFRVPEQQKGTLLKLAVSTENESLCRYLIANGADVGEKAMSRAVEKSLFSITRLLIEHGGIVTERMFAKAKKRGDSEIITLPQQHLHKDRGMLNGRKGFRSYIEMLSGSWGKQDPHVSASSLPPVENAQDGRPLWESLKSLRADRHT